MAGREQGSTPVSPVARAIEAAVEATGIPGITPDHEREQERNFDILPTHIDDFFLLVDVGTNPDLTRSQTERMHEMGPSYVVRAKTIARLIKLQKGPHDEYEALAIDIPGLRGGRDAVNGWEIQVNPTPEPEFDEGLLDKSLGERGPEFVHKKVTVTVELDPDVDDVPAFVGAMKRRLRRQGSKAEVKVGKTNLRVDEKELQRLVESGEVILATGAWTTRIKSWAVVPRVIDSQENLAETDAVIQNAIAETLN